MTAVIVAVVAGLTGVLAGLVPSIVVSPRRRMLRLMAEEQALLADVKDGRAAKHLRDAHRISTNRYRMWVQVRPADRSHRVVSQMVRLMVLAAGIAFVGSLVTFLADSGRAAQLGFGTASIVFLFTAIVLSFVPLIQMINEVSSGSEELLNLMQRRRRRVQRRLIRLGEQHAALVEVKAPQEQIAALEEEGRALAGRLTDLDQEIDDYRARKRENPPVWSLVKNRLSRSNA